MQKVILTLATPLIAAGSAWLCAAAAKYGVHLDPSGVNALAVAGATAGTAAMVKLIHDLEKRKQLQAVGAKLKTVEATVEAADPKAGSTVQEAVQAAEKAAEAKVLELAGKLHPPAPVAPAPAVAPVPDPHPLAGAQPPAPVQPIGNAPQAT